MRIVALAWLLFTVACASRAGECFMLLPLAGGRTRVSDVAECTVRTAPASTFKIPHALIALELGVVTDPMQPVAWDGSEQPFDTWERDHSLDSAMKSSVLWFFRRTAARIGAERMRAQLARLRYGSDGFEGDHTLFWTNGDFVVSPAEQLDFLARLFRGELPVSRAHVDAVKAAFLMPPGKITNAAGTHDFDIGWPVVRAKTGNTSVGGERVSWLVGQLERDGRQYVFVARKRARETLPTTAGADLARRALASR
jgi:beta-lactamase class D